MSLVLTKGPVCELNMMKRISRDSDKLVPMAESTCVPMDHVIWLPMIHNQAPSVSCKMPVPQKQATGSSPLLTSFTCSNSGTIRFQKMDKSSSDDQQDVFIRYELPEDIASIRQVITAAFASKSHLKHGEAEIVDALRQDGALVFSMVAICEGQIVGHVAGSKVLVDGKDWTWLGLGPVSVLPEWQGKGIGSSLIEDILGEMLSGRFTGCVVAGSPKFYERFGFERDPEMTFDGAPPSYFMRKVMIGPPSSGKVTYHKAFDLAQ